MSAPAPDVDQYLAELEKAPFFGDDQTPESFAYMAAYYRSRSKTKRNWFRFTSLAVIVLSGLLPLVASFASDTTIRGVAVNKNFLVAAVSATIAILAGVSTHFRWEVGWRGQTEALFALQNSRIEWEAAVAMARASASPNRLAELGAAFDRFRARTFEVVHAEMGDFFKVQQAPAAKLPPT